MSSNVRSFRQAVTTSPDDRGNLLLTDKKPQIYRSTKVAKYATRSSFHRVTYI